MSYDAIVVGARVAGSPTAMLLAREGYRVLLVDRDHFPSDMMSTHWVHTPAIARLKKWGLLEKLEATGSVPVRKATFDFGEVTLSGKIQPFGGVDAAYSPRRRVLDTMLVEAAVEAGVEFRPGHSVTGLPRDGDSVVGVVGHDESGKPFSERARIVIGADGMHSRIAREVGAEEYNRVETMTAVYYTYFRDLPVDGATIRLRPGRVIGVQPTNDGETIVFVVTPRSEFGAYKKDIEGTFYGAIEQWAPDLAAQIHLATRTERFTGTGDMPGFFRKPFGPGWALVGDAGYHRDPTLGHGIMDSFIDAELLVEGLKDAFEGRLTMDEALAVFQQQRDLYHAPDYALINSMADMSAPPPPEMLALVGAMEGNQPAIDQFFSTLFGAYPIQKFFSPENIGAIMSAAQEPLAQAA